MSTFDASKIAEQLSGDPFEFTDLDGELHELPNFDTLTGRQVDRFLQGDESVIREIAPDAWEKIQDMPIGVIEALARAWSEHGGESGKSSSGSPATAKPGTPRKQTSPSKGSTSKG